MSTTSMSSLRHVVLSVQGSHGFQYGMLRDFESEIVRLTGATTIPAPSWQAPQAIRGRLSHGTRYADLRRFVPKTGSFAVDADVLWLVLMGPESSWLDLYRAWDKRVGYRIVYVYDTFEEQLPAIRRLAAAAKWDLMITSFHGAVPMLERETGRPWVAVPQGVLLDRFAPVPLDQRSIAVSSYGRRLEHVHDALDGWGDQTGLHYDATVASALMPSVSPAYLYKQYAFHLRQSAFTVAWPVEMTNPSRAGSLSPVTCRWFEAAAAGTTMIGKGPSDPVFDKLLGPQAVLPLDAKPRSATETKEAMSAFWEKRHDHHRVAMERREALAHTWTWEARVKEILAHAKLS